MRVESNKKYSKNKVTILLIIAVAALTFIVGGYTIYARSQSIWPFAITQSQDSQESTNNSNTSQPSNTTDPTYSGEKIILPIPKVQMTVNLRYHQNQIVALLNQKYR